MKSILSKPAGRVENLAALLSGNVDAATMTGPSGGTRAAAQGFRYVVYGPDLHIPFAAATLITRRSLLNSHGPAIEKFFRATAEAMKILFLDKELTYKVLAKQLRINDRKLLDAAYDEEIKVMERRLEFKTKPFRRSSTKLQRSMRAPKIKTAGFRRPPLSGRATKTASSINFGRESSRAKLSLPSANGLRSADSLQRA